MKKAFFICYCGCGQVSDELDKGSYIRLQKNQQWSAKDCEKENKIVREFKNGSIIKVEEF